MAHSPLHIFLCLHFPSPLSSFPCFVHLESWFLSFQLDRSHPTANELLIFSLELIPLFSQLPWHFESVMSLRNSVITESWEKLISDLIQSPHFADENTARSGVGVGRWLSWFFYVGTLEPNVGFLPISRPCDPVICVWPSPFWITLWFVLVPSWKDYLEVCFFFFHLTVNILFIGNECKVSENLHS